MKKPSRSFAFLGLLACPVAAHTSGAPSQEAFPLNTEQLWGERAIQLRPDAQRLAELHDLEAVVFRGVPVPSSRGIEPVDLVLSRFHVVAPHATWYVDGRIVGGRAELEAGHTLWRGTVAGEPDSSVYLAFTRSGSRGWIERADGRSHLITIAPGGDRSRAYGVLVHESDPLLHAPDTRFQCGFESLAQPLAALEPEPHPASKDPSSRTAVTYECLVACETDYQYYRLFDDVQAATDYALALWGEVTDRYLAACDTFIRIPYLAIYSDSNDPWTTPDTAGPPPHGGTTYDLIYEFQDAWAGSPFPGGAHLAHFISGANLGGGLAYPWSVCNNDYGFAVSCDLHGMTTFPVPLRDHASYDFFVIAHELGHNFGNKHTHQYCPPIDQCAYPPYGACQTQTICQVGTIMSYCAGCTPQGQMNVRNAFHPQIAGYMRSRLPHSCLPTHAPASVSVRNGSGVNPLGYSSLGAPTLGTSWGAQVELAPPGLPFSLLAISSVGPFASPPGTSGHAIGELLIDISMPLLVRDVAAGEHWIPIPDDASLAGASLYTQAAAFGPAGLQLQNALDLHLAY